MKRQIKIAAALATTMAFTAPSGAVDNPNGCKVVERATPSDNSGQLSSSVTVGGGRVSAHTSGGNSVTVHSGDGKASSSATVGSSGGSSAVVASGTGDCTIYVDPGQKKDK